MAVKEKFVIFTYRNPRGRACINFAAESDMLYYQLNELGHYKQLKAVRKVAKHETALNAINRLSVAKGYEIAG